MKKLNLQILMTLRDLSQDELASLVSTLSEASAAVVLMNLPADLALELIQGLPREKQETMVITLISLESADDKLAAGVLAKVENEILKMLSSRFGRIDALGKLADLMCRMGSLQRTVLLNALREKKKTGFNQLTQKIIDHKKKKGLLFFEDILSMDDMLIRRHIGRVDIRDLALAMSQAGENIKAKLLENMSARFQEMVLDDLKHLGTVTPQEVETAQNKTIQTLKTKP